MGLGSMMSGIFGGGNSFRAQISPTLGYDPNARDANGRPIPAEVQEAEYYRKQQAEFQNQISRGQNLGLEKNLLDFSGAKKSMGQLQGLGTQLLAQGRGEGPNPALDQLRMTTDQNVRQQAAQAASARGINPALAARMSAQTGAGAQQTAAGQAALQSAQQQIAAQQAASGVLGGLANLYTQQGTAQGQAGLGLLGARTNQEAMIRQAQAAQQALTANTIANQNAVNAGVAAQNASTSFQYGQGAMSGLSSALGSMFSKGGEVPQMSMNPPKHIERGLGVEVDGRDYVVSSGSNKEQRSLTVDEAIRQAMARREAPSFDSPAEAEAFSRSRSQGSENDWEQILEHRVPQHMERGGILQAGMKLLPLLLMANKGGDVLPVQGGSGKFDQYGFEKGDPFIHMASGGDIDPMTMAFLQNQQANAMANIAKAGQQGGASLGQLGSQIGANLGAPGAGSASDLTTLSAAPSVAAGLENPFAAPTLPKFSVTGREAPSPYKLGNAFTLPGSGYGKGSVENKQTPQNTPLTAGEKRSLSEAIDLESKLTGSDLINPFSKGGAVKGKAKTRGDSPKNDTVPALLSPGEVVIPRSALTDAATAHDFLDKILARKRIRGYGDVLASQRELEMWTGGCMEGKK